MKQDVYKRQDISRWYDLTTTNALNMKFYANGRIDVDVYKRQASRYLEGTSEQRREDYGARPYLLRESAGRALQDARPDRCV